MREHVNKVLYYTLNHIIAIKNVIGTHSQNPANTAQQGGSESRSPDDHNTASETFPHRIQITLLSINRTAITQTQEREYDINQQDSDNSDDVVEGTKRTAFALCCQPGYLVTLKGRKDGDASAVFNRTLVTATDDG